MVDLAGAACAAELVLQLGGEARHRRHDAHLEVGHVVERPGRQEE